MLKETLSSQFVCILLDFVFKTVLKVLEDHKTTKFWAAQCLGLWSRSQKVSGSPCACVGFLWVLPASSRSPKTFMLG